MSVPGSPHAVVPDKPQETKARWGVISITLVCVLGYYLLGLIKQKPTSIIGIIILVLILYAWNVLIRRLATRANTFINVPSLGDGRESQGEIN